MTDAVIFDGIRTPIGRHGGALSRVRPDELLAAPIRALAARADFDLTLLEDVIAGDSNQAGEDCRNVARNAALLAGLPVSVGGITVNRLCGSGAAAVLDASRAIKSDEGQMFIAGGVESMSRAPWVLSKAQTAFARDQEIQDSTIGWRFPNPRFYSEFGSDTMPETGDNVGRDLGIRREDSDLFAHASQQKYAAAKADGFYREEILALETPGAGRKAPDILVEEDEHPRPDTTLEKLAGLRALYTDGVVTAGNASGINDGAVALLLGSRTLGEKLGRQPRARVLAGAIAGVDPFVDNPTPQEFFRRDPSDGRGPAHLTCFVPVTIDGTEFNELSARQGNINRNQYIGPGFQNWDFSAMKNFRFAERYNLQFRFESFNFTNTPFFGHPMRGRVRYTLNNGRLVYERD